MKTFRPPDVVLVAMTVMVAVAAAWGAFASLSALSTPHHLKTRIDAVETDIQQAQAVFNHPRAPSHYLADPICHASPSFAAELVRTEIGKAAQQSGLSQPTITLASNSEDLSSQSFPVMFTVEASDRYDLVLGFLNRLAQLEPEVFADSLDLTSKTSAVSLKLTGRVECLTSS